VLALVVGVSSAVTCLPVDDRTLVDGPDGVSGAGGSGGTGGTSANRGGMSGAAATGGAVEGGAGGSSGGEATGGTPSNGGSATGGKSASGSGGSRPGTGGSGNGGTTPGNAAGEGGEPPGGGGSGGEPTGGTGGKAPTGGTGGKPTTGGSATGGATGGNATGGSATGGSATGGNATGGKGSLIGPSCTGLATKCEGESCCTNIRVAAGSFKQGEDGLTIGSAMIPAGPAHDATVPAFSLDKYEVTVGRFKRFVAAYTGFPSTTSGAHPNIANSGWLAAFNSTLPTNSTDFETRMSTGSNCVSDANLMWTLGDEYPMNCVSWFEAFAFCIWDGGWLPTESEWEYVSSGGALERRYPWGDDDADATRAVAACKSTAQSCILPAGSKPLGAAALGNLDMAGSVWEWVLDYYADYEAGVACDGCAHLSGSQRVFRGGAFDNDLTPAPTPWLKSAVRNKDSPAKRFPGVGFRCGRNAP
jgi:sulfatase modifying factor 1